MSVKVRHVEYLKEVKPPNLKEKSLNKLAAYIVAQLRVCEYRSSICPCRYVDIDELQLDLDDDMDDLDWNPSGLSCRARTNLSKCRATCKTLFDVLHQDDLRRNPYLTWSNRELITSLNQRGVALPPHRVKSAYALALKQADETHVFEFMDLPQEIRFLVYESALLLDTEPQHSDTLNLDPASKPSLLQTCRQIRQEATAIFFRINHFILRFNREFSDEVQPRSVSWLKDYLSVDDLQNLRYITLAFQCCPQCPSYLINIDLCCRDPLRWTIRQYHVNSHLLSCEDHSASPEVTFMQERPDKLVMSSNSAELLLENMAIANGALDKLWKTCGHGDRVRPSYAGLPDLIKAVQEISMSPMVEL